MVSTPLNGQLPSVDDEKGLRPFTLGIFTDIQYADKPNTEISYLDTKRIRCYPRALSKAQLAVSEFNARKVDRVLHLGDIIDGNGTPDATAKDLDKVLEVLSDTKAPLDHIVGNHCMEVGRKELTRRLNLPTEFSSANRTLKLTPLWRMLQIDTMACSLHGPATELLRAAAEEHLQQNPDAPSSCYYNGGLGDSQTAWLHRELESARRDNVNVIIAGHHPSSDAAAPPALLMWHADAVLKLLAEFKDTVRAVFSGHYHHGGYASVDGIHHVVFESILDSRSDRGSYGFVSLFKDRIEIDGAGDMTSRILNFSSS